MSSDAAILSTDQREDGSHSRQEEEDMDHNDTEAASDERDLALQVVDQSVRHTNIPVLTCSFLAALTTGATSYSFGLYAGELKARLEFSQSQLDTISSAIFFAGIFSWVPGLVVDNFGTRTGTVSGGLMGAISLSCFWAVSTKFFPLEQHLLVPVLSSLGVLIFLSCALITGSVFKVIVTTCGAGSKGTAVGAAKGYVGLGAGVYSCIFESLKTKGQSDLDFLIMAALLFITNVTIPCLFLMPAHKVVQEEEFHDEATPLHFRTLYCSLAAMATIIIWNSLEELFNENKEPTPKLDDDNKHAGQNLPLAVFMLVIWVAPILSLLFLPKKSTLQVAEEEHEPEGESLLTENSNVEMNNENGDISLQRIQNSKDGNNQQDAEEADGGDVAHDLLRVPQEDPDNLNESETLGPDDVDEIGGDKNLWQMLRTPTAMLMLWTTTILVGGGIVMTNNMGQMVEALGFPKETTPASLAFFSVAQSGGRVITGALSESALNWPTKSFCINSGVPRPFFLVTASIAGFIAHMSLAVATTKAFFVIGCTLAGLAFGMVWPLMVLIIGEVFGTANVGANYMFFDGFTSAAGSVLLSKFLAQTVYEDNIDKKDNPENVICIGSACFSMTHSVVAVLSMACILTSVSMLFTTRKVYNSANLHTGH
ncbi:Nodulin-like [Seminavis robusta]|uniref:Nodulin-like n=1 Tax=Seminavis robusta TaxID=568900 RepID=A0A9N8DH97_9STRA|nr:Nodulin-like [Seminavis robusta]|eukprot:Sro120_g058490.1 Nodulin-like (652) ;mRNA; f:53480-55822